MYLFRLGCLSPGSFANSARPFANNFRNDRTEQAQGHLSRPCGSCEFLLQNYQIHEQQFLKAVYLGLAANLADIAAGIRLDVVCGFPAREAEAGIFVLEAPIFLFGENRLEQRFAVARLKRLCCHGVEKFLSVLLDSELAERRESRAERSGVLFTLDPGAKISRAGRTW